MQQAQVDAVMLYLSIDFNQGPLPLSYAMLPN
jgi:hypothetical protein